ncbi:hypothetical protein EMPS_10325 [Entomortierella parvispora]|uniref:Uncharacterized protein n=1 Tax=Entomortierella parvispora TaxID=205924 RepID=A0A9P3M0W7_9FUNG|nr:hypothetical protein EMPS_10325 [Entomortierella parvispora]
MCPSARALVMSCVSACGTWHPFKSAAATANHTNSNRQEEEALHLLLSNESHEAVDGGQDSQTEQLLKSLSRHMDILTAGSLFLLPSILPFLASAITAYTAQQQQQHRAQSPSPHTARWEGSSLSEQDGDGCFLNAAWILLLPSIGVMIPLALFKIMSVLEESAFQCPFKLWKKRRAAAARGAEASILNDVCAYDTPCGGRGGNARTAAAAMAAGWRGVCRFPSRHNNHSNNNNHSVHASMISSCPTILAIQSVWRSWRGYPHGYGPLSLDASTPTSPSDAASSSSVSSSPCHRCCSQSQNWSQFAAPPTLPLTLVSPRSESQLQEVDLGTPCCSEGQCLMAQNEKASEPVVQQMPMDNGQQQVNLEVEQVTVKVVRSVLPKPRSILLGSLLAWTFLMAVSSPLGFNKVDRTSGDLRAADLYRPALQDEEGPIHVPREKPLHKDGVLLKEEVSAAQGDDLVFPSPSAFMKNLRIGGFVIPEPHQQQAKEHSSQALEEIHRLEQEAEEEAQFMETMVTMLDMDEAIEGVEGKDGWTVIERVGFTNEERPSIETFRTDIVFLNKRSATEASKQEEQEAEEDEEIPDDLVEDAFDPDNLQAMTMDPEDEHVFRDFLLRLESEDETPDQAKKFEPFVQDTLTEEEKNIVPCRFRRAGSFLRNPIQTIRRLLFGGPAEESPRALVVNQDRPLFGQASMRGSKGLHDHTRGQVFTYVDGWTDLMIFAIALSLGGILVGLAQSRLLYQQLWDQHVAARYESVSPLIEEEVHDRAYWIGLVLSLLLGGSALSLTILMTLTECWDMPSVYFVGIGLAGMILVHAWVPNLSPEVEVDIDALNFDEEKSTEDHLAEQDPSSPYVQVFVGESLTKADEEDEEFMSNRRNACSLDESRRWEVNQSCLEPSCFSP